MRNLLTLPMLIMLAHGAYAEPRDSGRNHDRRDHARDDSRFGNDRRDNGRDNDWREDRHDHDRDWRGDGRRDNDRGDNNWNNDRYDNAGSDNYGNDWRNTRGVTPYVEVQVDPQTGKTNFDRVDPQTAPTAPLVPLEPPATTSYTQTRPSTQNSSDQDKTRQQTANPDGTVNNPLPQPVKRY